jgi:hypothetical protein
VVPSRREGDELGAAADILPRHRPAEAVLGAEAKRLSALRSRLSPIRKTCPAGTVIGPKSSPGLGPGRSCRSCAVGQRLANDRAAAKRRRRRAHREAGELDPARRIGVDRDHPGGALALHRLAVDDQRPPRISTVSPGRPITRLI